MEDEKKITTYIVESYNGKYCFKNDDLGMYLDLTILPLEDHYKKDSPNFDYCLADKEIFIEKIENHFGMKFI